MKIRKANRFGYITLTAIVLFTYLGSFAQTVTSGEYFFDTDPGVGNGTSIPFFTAGDTVDLNLSVNTSGLLNGFHKLYIRFKQSDNKWGIYEGRSFYIEKVNYIQPSAPISAGEYFFDTDPGVGNGTPIPSFTAADTVDLNLNINLTGVSAGFHKLYIRFKDGDNKWGIYEGRSFYIQKENEIQSSSPITAGEYFFDTDPGIGNGTPIPAFTAADTVDLNLNINVTGLSIGIHYLFIRFQDTSGIWGIYDSDTLEVALLPLAAVVSDSTEVTCFGGCNGSATVTPTGGMPYWGFAWFTDTYTPMGIVDSTATGLCAGTYHCIVTDANSNIDTTDVVITQPAQFSASPNATGATCGNNNGIAAVTITGGTFPYNYLWAMGDTTATVDSLAGGNVYQLTITDTNGCTASSNVFIAATPAIGLGLIATNPSCFGVCDGMVTTIITGGTLPISFYWNNASTNDSIINSCAANYSLTITDAVGCTDTASVQLIEPTEIITIVNTNNSDCGISNGNATVSVIGGLQPYDYNWSSGDSTLTADSLSAGIYTITVTDNNNCLNFETVLINDANGPIITVNSFTNPSCFGNTDGNIDVSIGGGTAPYTFSWSNGEITEDLTALEAGPYELIVTDIGGCTAIESITISDPNPISLSFSIFEANCGNADGFITASIFGGVAPYSYAWSSGGASITEANLAAGIYSLTITDANGCSANSLVAMSEAGGPTVSIVSITETECGFQNGAIDIDATGGSGTYSYSWSNSATTQDLTGVGSGSYEVTVTDQANCSGVAVAEIPATVPTVQNLCLVTVDTLTGTNLVVWEKPNIQGGIASYNIYRETSSFGVFQLVTNQAYAVESKYTDPVANPILHSWRYKVSVVDTCGNESPLSSYHKTIHLVLSQFGGDIYMSWDHYEGFVFPSYTVWRYTDQTGWVAIQTLASNLTSMTDPSPAGTGLDYFIEATPISPCTSTKAQTFGNTRSNRKTVVGGAAPDGIQEQSLQGIVIYPNPTSGIFEISFQNLKTNWKVEVYDITGKSLSYSKGINGKNYFVNLSDSESGIYLVRIQLGNKMTFRKVVKY